MNPSWENPSRGRNGDRLDFGHVGGTCTVGDPDSWFPELWDWLITTFQVELMLDVGCGVGHAQMFFEKAGVTSVGIDGSPEVLKHHVLSNDRSEDCPAHQCHDLITGPYLTFVRPDPIFDAVWCCELAEHIEEAHVQNVIDTVAKNCKKVVGFCAAPGGAGGYHHVNCKDPPYWIEKLTQAGLTYREDLTNEGRRLSPGAKYGRSSSYFERSGLIFTK